MARIKVLVVDDSAFMRQAIVKMLESGEDIEVVGTARSGEEGVARAEELLPDVITMDVEMPGISTSIVMTSGTSSSARVTPSSPLRAVPTTSISSLLSNILTIA